VGKRSDTPASPQGGSRIPPRILGLFIGVALGAVWGLVMWGIFELAGRDSGGRGLAYLVITMAMIGGGVAAFFGISGARKRGEKIAPKMPYRRSRSGRR
jgi:hypothetical protein